MSETVDPPGYPAPVQPASSGASQLPTRGLVVAVDGPASSGKSSVGAAVSRSLGLRFVDTGLLYRAVTALALAEGISPENVDGLIALVPRVALGDDGDGRLTRVLFDGVERDLSMHGPQVDGAVAVVARQGGLRAALLERQRELAATGGIVLAGRDIGTVVLPDADVKIYLDASAEERARRRIHERGLDEAGPEAAEVRAQLGVRDATDRTREVAPLRIAEDAVVIQTDGVSFEETVKRVIGVIAAATPPAKPAASVAPPAPATPTAPAKVRAKVHTKPNRIVEIAMRMDDHQSLLVRTVALSCRIASRLVARIRVEGMENVPRTGPVILAVNHISNADPVVIGAWLTPALKTRRIHWLGKREIFDIPVFGWIAASGGVHPVERGTADVDAFRLATRILEAGSVLLIFPEGTRSPTGELAEAKDGTALLALKTGAQIVPIGVNNADAVWRKGRILPAPLPRRTITVRIGKAFLPTDVLPTDLDRRSLKTATTLLIMRRIAGLLDPRHRGAYAGAIIPSAPPKA